MANAGRVELNLVAIGEDQLSAMLLKLEGQTKKTTDEVSKTAAAVNTLGQQHGRAASAVDSATKSVKAGADGFGSMTDRVKGTIAPVNAFREVVNQVRENVMFLLPGLGALAAGALALASDFLATEKQLDSATSAMFDAADQSAKLTAEMDRTSVAASKAARSTSEFASRIATLGAQAARLRGDLKLAEAYEREARSAATSGTIAAAEAQLNAADKAANEAEASLKRATKQQQDLATQAAILQANIQATEGQSGLVNERDRSRLAAVTITLANVTTQVELSKRAFDDASRGASQYARELVALDELQAAEDSQTPAPTPRTPGAPRRAPAPQDVGGSLIQMRDVIRDMEEPWLALERIAVDAGPDINALFGMALDSSIADSWGDLRDEISATSETMLGFLSVIDDAAQAAFPDLGAALQELGSITESYQQQISKIDDDVANKRITAMEAQTKAADATALSVINGSTAVVAGLAKELGGLREYYLVKSAGSLAAAFETSVSNPALSASYFTAAAMYGVAAARAGGGGGGGGASAAGRPSTGSGGIRDREGGSGTSVINISTMVTDRAAVRRTVGAILARRDRSGYSAFGGS